MTISVWCVTEAEKPLAAAEKPTAKEAMVEPRAQRQWLESVTLPALLALPALPAPHITVYRCRMVQRTGTSGRTCKTLRGLAIRRCPTRHGGALPSPFLGSVR